MISRLFEKLGLGRFLSAGTFRNLSTLMTSTFISAVIPILFAPVMSRIFESGDYGVLGLYMGITGLIGVLASSHYMQAIMIPREEEEASRIFWFAIFFCGGVSLLALVVIVTLALFTGVFSSTAVGNWIFLAPLSVLLNGLTAIMLTWANRIQQYKTLAANRIYQAVLTIAVQISLGLLVHNETGLLAGLIAGQLCSVLLLLLFFRKTSNTGVKPLQVQHFRQTAGKYRNFLFYTTPSEFINALINQLPVFLLQRFGGISYVGSYNFTQRLLGIPQQFLSSAIVEVFRQKASAHYSEHGNCSAVFNKTFRVLTLLAIIPFTAIAIFAQPLFAIIFGEEWREAGLFAQYLSILFFFRFIVSPLTYVYIVAGRLREDLVLHILFLILTVASFYITDRLVSDKRLLILSFSLAYTSVYLVYLARSWKFSKGIKTGAA